MVRKEHAVARHVHDPRRARDVADSAGTVETVGVRVDEGIEACDGRRLLRPSPPVFGEECFQFAAVHWTGRRGAVLGLMRIIDHPDRCITLTVRTTVMRGCRAATVSSVCPCAACAATGRERPRPSRLRRSPQACGVRPARRLYGLTAPSRISTRWRRTVPGAAPALPTDPRPRRRSPRCTTRSCPAHTGSPRPVWLYSSSLRVLSIPHARLRSALRRPHLRRRRPLRRPVSHCPERPGLLTRSMLRWCPSGGA